MRLIVFSQFASKDLQPFHENRNNCSEQSQCALLIFLTKHTFKHIRTTSGVGGYASGFISTDSKCHKRKRKAPFLLLPFPPNALALHSALWEKKITCGHHTEDNRTYLPPWGDTVSPCTRSFLRGKMTVSKIRKTSSFTLNA